jgi:hypothetical protein
MLANLHFPRGGKHSFTHPQIEKSIQKIRESVQLMVGDFNREPRIVEQVAGKWQAWALEGAFSCRDMIVFDKCWLAGAPHRMLTPSCMAGGHEVFAVSAPLRRWVFYLNGSRRISLEENKEEDDDYKYGVDIDDLGRTAEAMWCHRRQLWPFFWPYKQMVATVRCETQLKVKDPTVRGNPIFLAPGEKVLLLSHCDASPLHSAFCKTNGGVVGWLPSANLDGCTWLGVGERKFDPKPSA